MVAYKVDRDGLAGTIAVLRRESSGIAAAIDTLELAVAGVRDQWVGEAQEAYDAAHASWSLSMRSLNGALNRIIGGAEVAHEAYTIAYNKVNGVQ